MQITYVRALRGPNQWTLAPVIESFVDVGSWIDRSSESIPGFNERLMSWLPGLIEHRCSIGQRGGFLERLRRGTYMAHILEHVTLELHGLAGVDVYYGRARATSQDGVYTVVFKYKDETLGRACLAAARDLCMAAAEDQPFNLEAVAEYLRDIARKHALSPSVLAIVEAATRRNIPSRRVGDSRLVQFGYGARQRRMLGLLTDRLGAIAASLGQDRELAQRQLEAAGVPARLVEHADSTAPAVGAPDGENVFHLLVAGGRMIAALDVEGRDVTDDVHPAAAERAVEAVGGLRWEIAGIDVRAREIRVPLEAQGGAVVQLDAEPDLGPFLKPAAGQARPVDDEIVNLLFAPGDDGRIPIVAVTGTNGKTTVVRLVAHILRATGKCVGMACTDGVYVGGRRIVRGDCSGPASAAMVLTHPRVEAAVLETARGGILRAGLSFDQCHVSVVTNLGNGDHLGTGEVYTVEHLARVKRVIVEVTSPRGTAVLNAADPLVAEMSQKCPGNVLYFALDESNPVIVGHRARAGRAIFVRDRAVVLAEGESGEPIVELDRLSFTLGGRIRFQVENALAAIAAAWALGVPTAVIAAQAASFVSDLDHDPARFNLFRVGGATVIVDFGHNPDALKAIVDAIEYFPPSRRTAVYSSSGDRRDEDIIRMGELLGGAFDRVVLYEDADRYDRQPGEIFRLLRRGLASGARVRCVEELEGGLSALGHALETVEPGELLVAQAHMADPTAEYLRGLPGLEPLAAREE